MDILKPSETRLNEVLKSVYEVFVYEINNEFNFTRYTLSTDLPVFLSFIDFGTYYVKITRIDKIEYNKC